MTEMNEGEAITILVVDDHTVVRHGLKLFLQTIENFQVVGEAANGEEAIEQCLIKRPDIVLMDLKMPQMNGIEALRQLQKKCPDSKIVMLTTYHDDSDVQRALQAGAMGYLLKTASTAEIEQAIRAVHEGHPMLSREATDALLQAARKGLTPDRYHSLSVREVEILKLMAEGMTNRQISEKVKLSNSTVKFHVSSILAKLDVASRTEAVALALQEGYLS